MTFYAPFCIPFILGASVMFLTLAWKWGKWLWLLPRDDKKRILFGIPTCRTLAAAWEVVSESLLHRRIFRVNPLLGYMHMSLAFGWFLLIAVGWAETIAYLGFRYVPLQGHVFFKYFGTGLEHKPAFDFVMDLLLLFVLSGVALAWGKRFYSRAMGLRRTTKHVPGDRVALSALWFIFPARLVAESATCALYGGGGFLTGGPRGVDGRAYRHDAADESRNRGVVVLFVVPRGLLRGAAVLALHAHLHGDSVDFPASLPAELGRKGVLLRQFPGRSLLALRHLHRPLPVAERARVSTTCSRSTSCATAATTCCACKRLTTA